MKTTSTLYTNFAPYYDLLYGDKDYETEARRLTAYARRFSRSGGTAWLDVACGTGRHLEFLRERYQCVGVDGSAAMLRIARRRLPGVPLHRGDMRTFDLHRSFDVISCLFSAVGHLRSEEDIARAFANFARHLKPGGVVFVEPWVDPSKWLVGTVHLKAFESPTAKVVRVVYSGRRGVHSLLRSAYVAAEKGKGLKVVLDTDLLRLTPHARLVALLKKCGLSARHLPKGVSTVPGADRGLIIGVRPMRSPDR